MAQLETDGAPPIGVIPPPQQIVEDEGPIDYILNIQDDPINKILDIRSFPTMQESDPLFYGVDPVDQILNINSFLI